MAETMKDGNLSTTKVTQTTTTAGSRSSSLTGSNNPRSALSTTRSLTILAKFLATKSIRALTLSRTPATPPVSGCCRLWSLPSFTSRSPLSRSSCWCSRSVSLFVGLAPGESVLKLPFEGSGAVAAMSLCIGLWSRVPRESESKERGLRSRGVFGGLSKEIPSPLAKAAVPRSPVERPCLRTQR